MAVRSLLALVLVLCTPGALAQGTRGLIAGRTVDEAGAPIPNAFVTLRPTTPSEGSVELEVLSDAAGRFTFEGIPQGTYRVAAHMVGFHLTSANVDVPRSPNTDVALVLPVAPISDCVSDFWTKVEFRTRAGEQLPMAYLTVTRDGSRARSYEVLPAGRPDPCFSPTAADHVRLDVFGYGEHVIKRAGQDPGQITWRVGIDPTAGALAGRTPPGPPRGQVRGRVFDIYAGSVPDASVRFQPVDPQSGLPTFDVVTDARGRFDFEGVRTGTYRVTCRVRGYETTVEVHEVRPNALNEVTVTMRAAK